MIQSFNLEEFEKFQNKSYFLDSELKREVNFQDLDFNNQFFVSIPDYDTLEIIDRKCPKNFNGKHKSQIKQTIISRFSEMYDSIFKEFKSNRFTSSELYDYYLNSSKSQTVDHLRDFYEALDNKFIYLVSRHKYNSKFNRLVYIYIPGTSRFALVSTIEVEEIVEFYLCKSMSSYILGSQYSNMKSDTVISNQLEFFKNYIFLAYNEELLKIGVNNFHDRFKCDNKSISENLKDIVSILSKFNMYRLSTLKQSLIDDISWWFNFKYVCSHLNIDKNQIKSRKSIRLKIGQGKGGQGKSIQHYAITKLLDQFFIPYANVNIPDSKFVSNVFNTCRYVYNDEQSLPCYESENTLIRNFNQLGDIGNYYQAESKGKNPQSILVNSVIDLNTNDTHKLLNNKIACVYFDPNFSFGSIKFSNYIKSNYNDLFYSDPISSVKDLIERLLKYIPDDKSSLESILTMIEESNIIPDSDEEMKFRDVYELIYSFVKSQDVKKFTTKELFKSLKEDLADLNIHNSSKFRFYFVTFIASQFEHLLVTGSNKYSDGYGIYDFSNCFTNELKVPSISIEVNNECARFDELQKTLNTFIEDLSDKSDINTSPDTEKCATINSSDILAHPTITTAQETLDINDIFDKFIHT